MKLLLFSNKLHRIKVLLALLPLVQSLILNNYLESILYQK
jgi:hypothetical protein